MRILQSRISTKWVGASDEPARSLEAFVAVAPHHILVDDQSPIGKIRALEIAEPNDHDGIVFFAKDCETLIRGFRYLAQHTKASGKRSHHLKGHGGRNLAALGIKWDKGVSRYSNSAIAGITTVGFNLSLALRRGINKATNIRIGDNDRYQSVSSNMESSSRDGKILQRGAAVYICPNVVMPTRMSWGVTHRQIGDTMDFALLTSVTAQIFAGK